MTTLQLPYDRDHDGLVGVLDFLQVLRDWRTITNPLAKFLEVQRLWGLEHGWTHYETDLDVADCRDDTDLQLAVEQVNAGQTRWIRLERGRAYTAPTGLSFTRGGSGFDGPVVLGYFGDAPERPVLYMGGRGIHPRDDGSTVVGHFHVVGLDCRALQPGHGNGLFFWTRDGQAQTLAANIRAEDCTFRDFSVGITLQSDAYSGINLYRCGVFDCWNEANRGQGLFAQHVGDLTIEECVFDRNGWNHEQGRDASATIFSHNLYITNGGTNTTVRSNILSRAASHGLQLRCGGVVHDNAVFGCPIGILVGGGDEGRLEPDGVQADIARNVVTHATDINSTTPRGYGIDLKNIREGIIAGNLICEGSPTRNGARFPIGSWVSGGPIGVGVNATFSGNTCVRQDAIRFRSDCPGTRTFDATNYWQGGWNMGDGQPVPRDRAYTPPAPKELPADFYDQIRDPANGRWGGNWIDTNAICNEWRQHYGVG